jgi:type VII secretion-associated protein (TIGR03931 family)
VTRVAVQVGTAWVRVAAEGRLVAELPAAGASLPDVLAGLFDAPVDELVAVHAAGARALAAPTPATETLATRTRRVPAAVAALAQHGASTGRASAGHASPGHAVSHAVVVDVGYRGAEVAHVRAGQVAAVRHVAVGGAALDAVTAAVLARSGVAVAPAEARRVREALSLLPAVRTGTPPVVVPAADLRTALSEPLGAVVDAVVEVVRAAGAAGPGPVSPVLLVGGVARTPLLAELLDAAGVHDVQVADRPDAAAVLGALRMPGEPFLDTAPAGIAPTTTWLPPVVATRHRRSRAVLAALATAAAVLGLLAAGAALPTTPATPTSSASAASAGDLVQYGYAVRLPAGWAHTGGLPERRRSLLTPATAPDGTDLISVERTPLGYDADAEPQRARTELRARFAAAVAAGAPLSAFDDDARFTGRPVVSYREAGGGTTGDVDWYVVLDGDAQLSVGCRHTPTGENAVGAACATVVGSLRRTA